MSVPKASRVQSSVRRFADEVETLGLSASKAARLVQIERTLVWRALKGKSISSASAQLIESRRHLLWEGRRCFPSATSENATELLQYLLRAVQALEDLDRSRSSDLNLT